MLKKTVVMSMLISGYLSLAYGTTYSDYLDSGVNEAEYSEQKLLRAKIGSLKDIVHATGSAVYTRKSLSGTFTAEEIDILFRDDPQDSRSSQFLCDWLKSAEDTFKSPGADYDDYWITPPKELAAVSRFIVHRAENGDKLAESCVRRAFKAKIPTHRFTYLFQDHLLKAVAESSATLFRDEVKQIIKSIEVSTYKKAMFTNLPKLAYYKLKLEMVELLGFEKSAFDITNLEDILEAGINNILQYRLDEAFTALIRINGKSEDPETTQFIKTEFKRFLAYNDDKYEGIDGARVIISDLLVRYMKEKYGADFTN